uniref:DRBM domain-containing protein n=1 Tax=Steinernema glaseri TaxID=37863 RepID=A0A1I7Y0V0_9BILA
MPFQVPSQPQEQTKEQQAPIGKVVFRNVVGTADMHLPTKLELSKLAAKLPNAKYAPKEHNSLRMKMNNPDASVLLFTSGKMIVTGLKTVEDCKESAMRVARRLEKLGYAPRRTE